MKLSVIIPVYNEKNTVTKIIDVVRSVGVDKEIIIIDDGSTDGTREIISALRPSADLKVILHDRNYGKGRAIRTGISAATGDAVIIQDADLEYNPMDFLKLLSAMETSGAGVVYGSRFLGKRGVTAPLHRLVNFFLTWLTNILFSSRLTDMETCYKMMRSNIAKKLDLRSDGFEIEVELTYKILKLKEKIVEVPVSYKGRSIREGKKICWKDGVIAVWKLLRYRFGDA